MYETYNPLFVVLRGSSNNLDFFFSFETSQSFQIGVMSKMIKLYQALKDNKPYFKVCFYFMKFEYFASFLSKSNTLSQKKSSTRLLKIPHEIFKRLKNINKLRIRSFLSELDARLSTYVWCLVPPNLIENDHNFVFFCHKATL